jgi:hypothetical protein
MTNEPEHQGSKGPSWIERRRLKYKDQTLEELSRATTSELSPGERVIVGAECTSGSSLQWIGLMTLPSTLLIFVRGWLRVAILIGGPLALVLWFAIGYLKTKRYLVAVTDRRLILFGLKGIFATRAETTGQSTSYRRDQVGVLSFKSARRPSNTSAVMKLSIADPQGKRTLRLLFPSTMWGREASAIKAALDDQRPPWLRSADS